MTDVDGVLRWLLSRSRRPAERGFRTRFKVRSRPQGWSWRDLLIRPLKKRGNDLPGMIIVLVVLGYAVNGQFAM
jgi:hypothetical protein